MVLALPAVHAIVHRGRLVDDQRHRRIRHGGGALHLLCSRHVQGDIKLIFSPGALNDLGNRNFRVRGFVGGHCIGWVRVLRKCSRTFIIGVVHGDISALDLLIAALRRRRRRDGQHAQQQHGCQQQGQGPFHSFCHLVSIPP